MADVFLSVVDGNDVVVGRELRSVIHKTGLRHREVHVWLMTPKGELILQKRGPNKDTYPNLMDASAGGHVEEGQDYLEAALMEAQEELGLNLKEADLIPLAKVDMDQVDAGTGMHNVVYRMVYLHRFDGEIEDLQVEAGDGVGFESVTQAELLGNEAWRGKVIPGLLKPAYAPVWQAFDELTKN